MPLAWRQPNDPHADTPGGAGGSAQHLRRAAGTRRRPAPGGQRLRHIAAILNPKPGDHPSGATPSMRKWFIISCSNRARRRPSIAPTTAANRASGERMDNPRTRGRDRHAGANSLHLGPKGTPILPQHQLRFETHRARARRSGTIASLRAIRATPPPWRRLPPRPAENAAAPAIKS